MPNFEPPIVVATLAALSDIHVAELDEGTLAFVEDQNTFYLLRKASGLPVFSPDVIAPGPGSPIAGAATARWIRQPPSGGLIKTICGKLITDVVATSMSPLVLPSTAFNVSQPGLHLLATATFAGVYNQPGLAQFEMLLDGLNLVGAKITGCCEEQQGESVNGALTSCSDDLSLGMHTLSIRLTPTGSLAVTVNAASEFKDRHARFTALLSSV